MVSAPITIVSLGASFCLICQITGHIFRFHERQLPDNLFRNRAVVYFLPPLVRTSNETPICESSSRLLGEAEPNIIFFISSFLQSPYCNRARPVAIRSVFPSCITQSKIAPLTLRSSHQHSSSVSSSSPISPQAFPLSITSVKPPIQETFLPVQVFILIRN